MKLKTVSVTYERKVNLGDFNSAHIGITLWADIDEGESEATVAESLWQMATANVKAKYDTVTKNITAQAEQVYLGLPKQVQEELSDAN